MVAGFFGAGVALAAGFAATLGAAVFFAVSAFLAAGLLTVLASDFATGAALAAGFAVVFLLERVSK